MNGSQEHPDVPTQPPTLPATPPPAPPMQAAQPQPPVHQAVAGRARGLQPKSPVVACLLSLMPGVGQIYVGYYRLGFIHNVVFSGTIAFLANSSGRNPLLPVMSIFLAFFIIYNIVDAGHRAIRYNLALDGVEGVELPSMNSLVPTFGGSLAGGLALIGLGVVLLANTRFGLSLDWIEEWWPIAPIALGVYLIVKAIQDRTSGLRSAGTAAGGPPTYGSDTDSSPLV